MQYIVFGCGTIGERALRELKKKNVYCFCDNSNSKVGSNYFGKRIISFTELKVIYKDYLIVCALNQTNYNQVELQLCNAGIYNFLSFDMWKFAVINYGKKYNINNVLSDASKVGYIKSEYYKCKCMQSDRRIEYLCSHTDVKLFRPADGYMRIRQKLLLEFAYEFIEEISGTLDIHPFLVTGNLLGTFRYNGFIPWDDDFDFGLLRDEYEKLFQYAKTHYHVCICEDSEINIQKWIDDCTKKYAGEYILFIYNDVIQISKGTSALDRVMADFFAYDYYDDELEFDQFMAYAMEIQKNLNTLSDKSILQKYKYIRSCIHEKDYTAVKSSKVYFGLDNFEVFDKNFNDDWMNSNIIFPLTKRRFEDKEFWTPNNMEKFLEYEYRDYNAYPDDVGENPHDYWDEYIEDNYINVEFYLVDAFEIYHFAPYYEEFRKRGVNAVFVAEKCEYNTSGEWFDYKEAVKILNRCGYRYKNICNRNAQIAMTTQDAKVLSKYADNTYKVHLNYGVGFIKNHYSLSERTLEGFDACIVHGEYQKEKLGQLKADTKIMIGGYPKHYYYKIPDQDEIKNELGINTEKKILVYFPTWDEDCGIIKFGNQIAKLKNQYFIIIKLHHVLSRDFSNPARKMAYEIADMVLGGNYDFEKATALADFILSDAKSGATLESLYLNQQTPAAFLSVRENINEWYYPEISMAAPVISNPDRLNEVIENYKLPDFIESRKNVILRCYGKSNYPYFKDNVSDLLQVI